MARHSTADEVLAGHILALGADAGGVYNAIWNELGYLHLKWSQYRELFAGSEARFDVLNRSAPTFFRLLGDVLWEDTLLHIARLTDDVGTGKRRNLSMRALQLAISDNALREELEPLIQDAEQKASFARDWRNRHIAHRDFALSLLEGARPLEAGSRQAVGDALRALDAIFQAVERKVFKADIVFDPFLHTGGALDLLYIIRDGILAEDARQARLHEGKLLPEDLIDAPAL